MIIKRLCVIADGYPSKYRVVNVFVENLVNALADQGVQCTVIAPQSVSKSIKRRIPLLPYYQERRTRAGRKVAIYMPKYVSVSSKKFGPVNTAEMTLRNFRRAARKTFSMLHAEQSFDAVYGHFIFPAGITANMLGREYGIPAFLAYGENTTYTIDYLGDEKTRALLSGLTGAVSVSTVNRHVLIQKALVPDERIAVFPNAIDPQIFHPSDQEKAREKLCLPTKRFLVAFVGRFVEVKGPDRLAAALEQLNDPEIGAIFIGSGPITPKCDGIVFCGELQHEALPDALCAADIFVLPTHAEGCCNAIIEAMACQLPVVSSDLPFNDDILDESCSLRVDTMDTSAIADAIWTLKQDGDLRSRLAEGARNKASMLTINHRAAGILQFLEDIAQS